jgi:hypothetical protein
MYCFWMAAVLFLSPLFGVLYCDLPLPQYLEFPPQTRYVVHAPFSWPLFLVLLSFIAAVCFSFLLRLVKYRAKQEKQKNISYPFPWWGWLGIIVVPAFWILAWNRFAFFQSLQPYTFTPLWLGYILIINGLTCRRKGTCHLCSRSRFFLALFPASAIFWWYFEYLNRFVQNWYYLGGENISAAEYIIHASICFSTVLPAVLSTHEFLETFPRLTAAFRDWHAVTVNSKKKIGLLFVAGTVFSLACLAVFPDYLFPLVWISPLLVILGVQFLARRPTIINDVQQGNWQHIVLPALAALVCGFLWEMWNWKSQVHWEYSIPFVDRFRIFAMPLLGYAGYLPFGLECIAVTSLIKERIMDNETII